MGALVCALIGVALSKLAAAMEDAMRKGEDFFDSAAPHPNQVAPIDDDDDGSQPTSAGPSSPARSRPQTASAASPTTVKAITSPTSRPVTPAAVHPAWESGEPGKS